MGAVGTGGPSPLLPSRQAWGCRGDGDVSVAATALGSESRAALNAPRPQCRATPVLGFLQPEALSGLQVARYACLVGQRSYSLLALLLSRTAYPPGGLTGLHL